MAGRVPALRGHPAGWGLCLCPPSMGDRCFSICLGWQLLLSQEEAAVPRRKRMMMRTAGQSNLEAPSTGAMAKE